MSEQKPSRDDLVRGLIDIGEHGIATEDDAALDAYFAGDYVFHGPDGDLDYPALKSYFASLRAAFTGFQVTRDQVIAEGNLVAARTTMTGIFEHEFTQSPAGPLPPNGERVTFRIINLFRYDDQGKLAEEWVQTDNRGLLRQLGADTGVSSKPYRSASRCPGRAGTPRRRSARCRPGGPVPTRPE